jgi:uncharacterized protein
MSPVQSDYKVNPDRPSTWIRYRDGLCESCRAGCCHLPVEVRFEDLKKLGLAQEGDREKQVARLLTSKGIVANYRHATGLFLLKAKSNGACPFLGKDFLCTVYEKRPEVCRKFPREIGPRPGYCPSTKR